MRSLQDDSRLKLYLAAAAAAVVLLVIAAAVLFHQSSGSAKHARLVLNKGTPAAQTMQLEIVASAVDQAKGLGGRTSLAPNTGMLFKYPNTAQRCMWMKDMHFNIDIIWADSTKRVTSIVPNLNPTTYPQSYCANAQYVIELQSGTARAGGLRVGQTIDF